MQDPAPEVYFRGTFSYRGRHLEVGLFLLLFSALTVCLFAGRIMRRTIEWNWGTLTDVLVNLILVGFCAWVGGREVYRVWRKTTCEIVIDHRGCLDTTCSRRKFLPWSEIAMLGLSYHVEPYHFVMRARSPFWLIRTLETDQGLTWEEGVAVLHAIKREVLPNHPHLKLTP